MRAVELIDLLSRVDPQTVVHIAGPYAFHIDVADKHNSSRVTVIGRLPDGSPVYSYPGDGRPTVTVPKSIILRGSKSWSGPEPTWRLTGNWPKTSSWANRAAKIERELALRALGGT